MKRPRIERVPSDYRPDYPQGLSADQYRELIAPDARGRTLSAAVAASLALGGSALAQGPGGDDRERALLALLNRYSGEHSHKSYWYERSTFQSSRNAYDSPVVVPNIPICFGNSHNGIFDAGRARQLAREVFAVYGLKAAADQVVREEGVEARLDGYDRERKVGFKLRGKAPEPNGMMRGAEPEPPATDLDVEEHSRLAKNGHRIHVADLDGYPLMDGDQFTPTVAYLAGIVDFLNSVTDGPDLALEAVLCRRMQRFPLPQTLELPTGSTLEWTAGGGTLRITARTLVPVQIDPKKGAQVRVEGKGRFVEEWQDLERPLPTTGRPTVLRLTCMPQTEGAKVSVRIAQAGAVPLQIDATGPIAFLPGRFEPARPFTIMLQLEKGDYWIGPHVQVGAPE